MSNETESLVFFTPYGRQAGSSRVRVFEWIEYLDLKATVHAFTNDNKAGLREMIRSPLKFLVRNYEVSKTKIDDNATVIIHREASPLSNGDIEVELLGSGAKGILDLDDGLHWDWGGQQITRRLRPKAPKAIRMMKAADLVIAGNDLIAEWASQHARRVVVIPSCVAPQKYLRKLNYELHDPPKLGWIGSLATERYLKESEAALSAIHARFETELDIVTELRGSSEVAIQDAQRLSWSENNAYSLPAQWDVGIMPLTDGIFERCKCAYKLLQYAAAGLPFAASPIGVNSELLPSRLSDGEIGRQIIDLLSMSADNRRAIAESQDQMIESSYSFKAQAKAFLTAISDDSFE